MRNLCDEVFGYKNFVAQVIWERAFSPVNLKKHFSESHDYILCYAIDKENTLCHGLPRSAEADDRYSNPDSDPRGVWTSGDMTVGPRVASKVYPIKLPSGREVLPPSGRCWLLDKKTFEEYVSDNRIWFGNSGDNVPRTKRFLSEVKQGITPMTIWKYQDVGHSQDATKRLKEIFDGHAYFDYPKPVDLVKRCLQLYSDKDSIILDFFSGSATTAHAVMELNAEDGGNRKFIMVQLPEKTSEKSEAYKAGYETICDIGKERIRRAAAKIHEAYPDAHFDDGFRVFKVDSSNMNDIYRAPHEMDQAMLEGLTESMKSDRSAEDLLFGCVLSWGLPLSLSYTSETIEGYTIHDYHDGDLMACFDDAIPMSIYETIAKRRPLRVVFKDSSFTRADDKTNVMEKFKLLSPDTTIKVI